MRCNASRSGSDGTDSRSAETAKGTLGCGSESGIVTVLFHGNYFGRRNLQLCGCRLVYHRGRCGAASFRYGVRKRRLPRLRACVCAAAVRSAQVEGITCFFHDIGLGVRLSAQNYDDFLRPQGNTIIGVRWRLRNDDRITFGIGLQDIWNSSSCIPFGLGPSVHFGYTF